MPGVGDGEILKRDILGISSSSPSLIPALEPPALLQLLASKHLLTMADENQMRKRFEAIRPEQVAQMAQFVVQHGEALGPWENAINAGLISAATHASLIGDLPGGVRKMILMSRPDSSTARPSQPFRTTICWIRLLLPRRRGRSRVRFGDRAPRLRTVERASAQIDPRSCSKQRSTPLGAKNSIRLGCMSSVTTRLLSCKPIGRSE